MSCGTFQNTCVLLWGYLKIKPKADVKNSEGFSMISEGSFARSYYQSTSSPSCWHTFALGYTHREGIKVTLEYALLPSKRISFPGKYQYFSVAESSQLHCTEIQFFLASCKSQIIVHTPDRLTKGELRHLNASDA